MRITPKTAAVLATVFAVLLGGAWVILDLVVRPKFEHLEAEAHARDRARLEANLNAVSTEVRSRTLDYARWDDTYAYIARPNAAYIENNFSDRWFIDYGVDLIAFYAEDGSVIWARRRRIDGLIGQDANLAQDIIAEARQAALARRGPRTAVTWADGGPMLFAIARVTRSNGAGPPRGFVVIGRRLNGVALRNQTQLDLTFIAASDTSADLPERLDSASATESWTTRDRLHTLIPLRGADDVLAGAALASTSRDLTALGAQTTSLTLGVLTLMFAGVFAVLWLLLRHIVIERIERLERHIRAQSHSPAPLPHDAARDEIAALTSAYNDLTERLARAIGGERRAVEELETIGAASRMKSDFLANISHELRTPLNDVIGYAELIEEDLSAASNPTTSADLARIITAARRMLALVNELYDLSRLEAAQLDITPEPFDVEEMVQGAIDLIAPLARASGCVLRLNMPTLLDEACSDQNRLRQCLVSVLAHACRRTTGAVHFTAERTFGPSGGVLRFEVCDSGPAMTREQMAALFEPFDSNGGPQGSAARLGIAVARKLIVMLGGTLEAENISSRGCRFILTAPANMAAPHESSLAAA